MTARYQYRLRGGADEPINSKSRGSATLGLPPEHPTLPSLLRDAGYRTALIGKWHLGWDWDSMRKPGTPKGSILHGDFDWSKPVLGGPLYPPHGADALSVGGRDDRMTRRG